MDDEFSSYLSGEKLYGDNFSIDEINQWFDDEAAGYANLGAKEKHKYQYNYHALNYQHGFRFLGGKIFNEVLGLGSAYGDEFKPIASSIRRITILDPSVSFSDTHEILGTPCNYLALRADGDIPFQRNRFDLVTSFGVLHLIPNVSHVIIECNRCLKSEGIMLLREPIVSMGDWRRPRTGLSKKRLWDTFALDA